MKMYLTELRIAFKKIEEIIGLKDFNYFYGQIGTGKSSIARLIDYCLGGDLEFTPALQSEFVGVTLLLKLNNIDILLNRLNHSSHIRAGWSKANQQYDIMVPARKPAGEVIVNSGIENLSDLIFKLAGYNPPKVRKSKIKEESELARLSIRDLLWYCYLDQDTIDSGFFHLDSEAEFFKRLKSRDVLRFILGYHQEAVAELEVELEEIRKKRLGQQEAAQILKGALEAVQVGTEADIVRRIDAKNEELDHVIMEIEKIREGTIEPHNHAVDDLRNKGRELTSEIESLEDATDSVQDIIKDDKRHLNELSMLTLKIRRTLSARAVLNDLDFINCPRCAQPLPKYEQSVCTVCGQSSQVQDNNLSNIEMINKDKDARRLELEKAIHSHESQLSIIKQRIHEQREKKSKIDARLSEAMKRYDTIYLSQALSLEHRMASLEQEISELDRLKRLPRKVDESYASANLLLVREEQIKRELKDARSKAERDTTNLKLLESLFLDCLLRSKIPGFDNADRVSIQSPNFLPEVTSPETGDLIITSFENLGSGGKKTLFKCCFAVAIHRLASKIGAHIPNILIIDSPMKNISERENITQFQGFHNMLYDLAMTELKGYQFILFDKELFPPSKNFGRSFMERHMTPNDQSNPPLIPYYKGL